MKILFTKETTSPIYADALTIRKAVFVEEQGVPVTREVDQDENQAIHFVLYLKEQPVATVRLLPLSEKNIKVQRMAVLKEFRQQQLGAELLQAAESYAKEHNFHEIQLGAQAAALAFYQKQNYQVDGELFEDAGIPHLHMKKSLN
ncbi:putative GNAT family N-acyltransferase [Enterococcus sp. PF1-24]|uniref:GNAT family N-acetyltransferase n=1 Tax=unclassified Enterococcus TaxID=2608891 RepID=UPI002474F9FD|nr:MULTISPECIES: GNAT family N-acetyltransferase [unclassified Enterococcus]MDH6363626.1 putative GNAT family N-acyltransferase [Enterococcus sp. PFB1-1]MDH6400861.1 putative GNAT family N-acyltransferase [Enterococcus sp. PF1-24]